MTAAPTEYRVRRHPTVPAHRLVQWRPLGQDRWRYCAWVRTADEASDAMTAHHAGMR